MKTFGLLLLIAAIATAKKSPLEEQLTDIFGAEGLERKCSNAGDKARTCCFVCRPDADQKPWEKTKQTWTEVSATPGEGDVTTNGWKYQTKEVGGDKVDEYEVSLPTEPTVCNAILLPGAEGEAKWVSDGATFFGMCKAAAEAAADKAGCPEGQIAFPSESARCSKLTATEEGVFGAQCSGADSNDGKDDCSKQNDELKEVLKVSDQKDKLVDFPDLAAPVEADTSAEADTTAEADAAPAAAY
jgi:hypothetical protein